LFTRQKSQRDAILCDASPTQSRFCPPCMAACPAAPIPGGAGVCVCICVCECVRACVRAWCVYKPTQWCVYKPTPTPTPTCAPLREVAKGPGHHLPRIAGGAQGRRRRRSPPEESRRQHAKAARLDASPGPRRDLERLNSGLATARAI
jgi:hypothetical protein